jgi:hypothetical protein
MNQDGEHYLKNYGCVYCDIGVAESRTSAIAVVAVLSFITFISLLAFANAPGLL